MSCLIADYASGAALLEGLHAFLTKGHTLRPTYTGVGTGYCDDAIGTTSSVHEIITLTFTSATAFSVSGSVSGAMGSGTVGTLFSHARFQATIVAGSTPWAAGDTITWTMTSPWQPLVYTSGQSYIYRAPGDDGSKEVNVGWTVKSNSSGGYFGAKIGAYPTWISQNFQWRPWTACWWPLGTYSGSSCRLFVRASGQYAYAVCRVGTYYMAMCAGLYDSIGTWDQMPHPYAVGGCISWPIEPADTSTAWAHSVTSMFSPAQPAISDNYTPALNRGGASLYIRTPANWWAWVSRMLPGAEGFTYTRGMAVRMSSANLNNAVLTACLDDSIPTWPFVIAKDWVPDSAQSGNYDFSSLDLQGILGSLPFVRIIPGYDKSGNLLVAESSFRVKKTRAKHVIMQTMNNSSADSLYSLEMV